jgi:hypothetical protein
MPTNSNSPRPKASKNKKKKSTSQKSSKAEVSVRVRTPRQTAVSTAPVALAASQIRPSFIAKSGPKNSLRVHAVDYIGPIVPETVGRGQIISSVLYSPGRLNNTKLQTLSALYERYNVQHLKFHFSSALPTTVGGALLMAFDKDPTDMPLERDAAIRHLIGLSSCTQFSPWEHATLNVTVENLQNLYFTSRGAASNESGADFRLEYFGSMLVAIMTSGSLQPSTQIGDIWVESDIVFYDPTYEPQQAACVIDRIQGGTTAYTVTSDTGFNDIGSSASGTVVQASDFAAFDAQGSGDAYINNAHLHMDPGHWTITDVISSLTGGTITTETLLATPISFGGIVPGVPNTTLVPVSEVLGGANGYTGVFDFTLPETILHPVSNAILPVFTWLLTSTLSGTAGSYATRQVRDTKFPQD